MATVASSIDRAGAVPEGDSVYKFAGRLREALEGREILAARAHGPGPVPQVHRLLGATCDGVETHGKNLFVLFDNGLALRGHLRMYGTWHVYKPGQEWSLPERELRLMLETADSVVANFRAPVIELLERRALRLHRPVRDLGPDLLDDEFDPDEAFRRFRDPLRATLTLGDAIMDQKAMAGVGNIWKHETLFRARLNPWLTVAELDDEKLREVISLSQELLRASVGFPLEDGSKPRRPSYFTYMRAGHPCRRCYTRLRSRRQGLDLRYTTWCPKCQPGPNGPQEAAAGVSERA